MVEASKLELELEPSKLSKMAVYKNRKYEMFLEPRVLISELSDHGSKISALFLG
jgi:hypothetical protein